MGEPSVAIYILCCQEEEMGWRDGEDLWCSKASSEKAAGTVPCVTNGRGTSKWYPITHTLFYPSMTGIRHRKALYTCATLSPELASPIRLAGPSLTTALPSLLNPCCLSTGKVSGCPRVCLSQPYFHFIFYRTNSKCGFIFVGFMSVFQCEFRRTRVL